MEGESGKEGENGGKEDSDDFFYVITKLPIKKERYYRWTRSRVPLNCSPLVL